MVKQLAKKYIVGLCVWSLLVGIVGLGVKYSGSIFIVVGAIVLFLISGTLFVFTGEAILKFVEEKEVIENATQPFTKNRKRM